MMRQEPALHQRLLAETRVPVPPILAHDFSRHKIDRDYLIMPKLAGLPLSEASLSPTAQARALQEWGEYVAQIHGLQVERQGTVTGVIDFDRACWGDAEWDLAIAEYCGVTTPAFWQGYGGQLENKVGEAAIRRFFYLLYEHQKYIVISISARHNNPARARRYADDCRRALGNFRKTGRPVF